MASKVKDAKARADAEFKKQGQKREADAVWAQHESSRKAEYDKTARLKAQRLEREAAAAETAKAAPRKKPAKSAKKVPT